MRKLFDQEFDDMELLDGALELNVSINPETDVTWCKQQLETLLIEAEEQLNDITDSSARLAAFIDLFYTQWGFQGDQETYYDHNNGFIDKVLSSRKGIPVSLGSIFLYLGRQLGFPLEAVNFPTQFVVKVVWPEQEPLFINPFNGEFVTKKTLTAWLIGYDGPLAQLTDEHLATTDHSTVIGRWLALHKGALIRAEQFELALRCTSLALTFVPDDPYEIRDRGFIYQQLDCHQVAVDDFQYFIDQCPDDPAVELLKSQVKSLSHSVAMVH